MKRIPELDSLRGLAALAVLTFHLAPAYGTYGWSAVDLFFVLSGYLITSILIRTRGTRHQLFNFYMRRSLRIWPIYYLTLFALLAVNTVMPVRYPIAALPYYLTYTQNLPLYWSSHTPAFIPGFSHTWTLAMEEQFYIIWPLLVCFAGRRTLTVALAAFLGTSLWLRYQGFSPNLLFSRGEGFALGGLLGVMLASSAASDREAAGRRRPGFALAAAAGVALLAALFTIDGPVQTPLGTMSFRPTYDNLIFPFCVLFFGLVGLVVGASGHPGLAFLRARWLVYLGTISYGLYLYHIPVVQMAEAFSRRVFHVSAPLDGTRPLYRSLIEFTISFLAASFSWRFIERPILALKDRFRYGTAATPPPPPTAADVPHGGEALSLAPAPPA